MEIKKLTQKYLNQFLASKHPMDKNAKNTLKLLLKIMNQPKL